MYLQMLVDVKPFSLNCGLFEIVDIKFGEILQNYYRKPRYLIQNDFIKHLLDVTI